MRKCLVLASFLSYLSAMPALADGPPAFQITYQPAEVVTYPEAVTSLTKMTLLNSSGEQASDVIVSIPAQKPVDNYTIMLGEMPAGYGINFVKAVEVPGDAAAASTPEADVVWHVEYTNADGKRTAVDITGQPAT